MDLNILFVLSLLLAISLGIFELMSHAQPSPYMDEIFHIPQAQRYCKGKFLEVGMY